MGNFFEKFNIKYIHQILGKPYLEKTKTYNNSECTYGFLGVDNLYESNTFHGANSKSERNMSKRTKFGKIWGSHILHS